MYKNSIEKHQKVPIDKKAVGYNAKITVALLWVTVIRPKKIESFEVRDCQQFIQDDPGLFRLS